MEVDVDLQPGELLKLNPFVLNVHHTYGGQNMTWYKPKFPLGWRYDMYDGYMYVYYRNVDDAINDFRRVLEAGDRDVIVHFKRTPEEPRELDFFAGMLD